MRVKGSNAWRNDGARMATLDRMRGATYEEKVDYSRALVRRSAAMSPRPAVACSWGKDSMVVLHLARCELGEVLVSWVNTGYEVPDTYRLKSRMVKEWDLRVLEARPGVKFPELVARWGWPLAGRGGNSPESRAAGKCCRALKIRPTMRQMRAEGITLQWTGMRADEARMRRVAYIQYGDLFWSKWWKVWRCHPIMHWTRDDVLRYTRENWIPLNGVYKRQSGIIRGRNGCWCCTVAAGYGRMSWLREQYPWLWDKLVVHWGFGQFILEQRVERGARGGGGWREAQVARAWLDLGIEEAAERQPCLFDGVDDGGEVVPVPGSREMVSS